MGTQWAEVVSMAMAAIIKSENCQYTRVCSTTDCKSDGMSLKSHYVVRKKKEGKPVLYGNCAFLVQRPWANSPMWREPQVRTMLESCARRQFEKCLHTIIGVVPMVHQNHAERTPTRKADHGCLLADVWTLGVIGRVLYIHLWFHWRTILHTPLIPLVEFSYAHLAPAGWLIVVLLLI